MFEKLEKVKIRYAELNELLSSPDIANDQKRFREISKEYSDLTGIVNAYNEYNNLNKQLSENKELIYSSSDSELIDLAKEEQTLLEEKLISLENQIKELLIPNDPEDSKNAILEIRAGTGGEEAGLFAAELHRMYSRYFEKIGWKTELMEFSEGSTPGSLKEVIVSVSGNNVYGNLKFESGVHRVQRVPKTEANGRVHTSAASVAVLPE
ncbi:MAG TPA: peptide chain release factor 1, partial [Bacteroidetes bacterium]|nr:peptide chain release factor 1 [Bacteroidota bacterium]